MNQIKLGVIGPGLIWHNMHKDILKSMSDTFKIVAFSARTDETLNKAKDDFKDALCFKNVDDLLDLDLDAVLIALPIKDNGDMAIKALEKGKHIFIEKPLAYNSELANKIIEISNKTHKQVYVLENFVYKPLIRKIEEVINNGIIGKPVYCDARQHYVLDSNKNKNDAYAFTSWRIKGDFPLGCFMDGGIHYLSALTKIFGKPESIYASGSKQREGYGDYDHILAILEYENSLRINFSQSGTLDGDKEIIKIWGMDGYLSYEKDYLKIIKNGEESKIPVTPVESHLAMWQYLASCFIENKEPLYTMYDATSDIKLCEAISTSLEKHIPINTK